MAGWMVLPEILLLDIYSYLSLKEKLSASTTCKHWRELLYHPRNWGHITFDYTASNCDREIYLKSKTGHFLRSCTIKLPISNQLYIDDEVKSEDGFNNEEFGCLLRKLSHNQNLTSLCFEQSAPQQYFYSLRHPEHQTRAQTSTQKHKVAGVHRSQGRDEIREFYGIHLRTHSNLDANLLCDYLRRIIRTSGSLTYLSLGGIPELTQHNHEIINYLARYQSRHIKSLHIDRFVGLLQAQHEPIEMTNLLSLRALQHLSLDMSDLSDQLLVCLTEGCHAKLRSLTLNLLHHKEGVRQVANRTWRLIHQSYPELVLTLNIIRCAAAVRDMMTVITPSMPLSKLRILFCDEFYVSGLHHVARHQSLTLSHLTIIESMREGPMYYDIGVDEQDPFVMMAWRCKNLSSFTVLGVALKEHDVLAVARLRGPQLLVFEVLEECITSFSYEDGEFEEDFTMSFDVFCEEISTSLGQEWLPLTLEDEDIDDSIHDYELPEARVFIPILQSDHKLPPLNPLHQQAEEGA